MHFCTFAPEKPPHTQVSSGHCLMSVHSLPPELLLVELLLVDDPPDDEPPDDEPPEDDVEELVLSSPLQAASAAIETKAMTAMEPIRANIARVYTRPAHASGSR